MSESYMNKNLNRKDLNRRSMLQYARTVQDSKKTFARVRKKKNVDSFLDEPSGRESQPRHHNVFDITSDGRNHVVPRKNKPIQYFGKTKPTENLFPVRRKKIDDETRTLYRFQKNFYNAFSTLDQNTQKILDHIIYSIPTWVKEFHCYTQWLIECEKTESILLKEFVHRTIKQISKTFKSKEIERVQLVDHLPPVEKSIVIQKLDDSNSWMVDVAKTEFYYAFKRHYESDKASERYERRQIAEMIKPNVLQNIHVVAPKKTRLDSRKMKNLTDENLSRRWNTEMSEESILWDENGKKIPWKTTVLHPKIQEEVNEKMFQVHVAKLARERSNAPISKPNIKSKVK